MKKTDTVGLYYPTTPIANSYLNDLNVKILDNLLPTLIKDKDKNIRYIKVLSQEDFNTTEPANDTLYFINDITDSIMSVTNILDVAVSNSSSADGTPNQLWMLTNDTEAEELDLWCGNIKSGQLRLKKVFSGYVDGRIAFDGVYQQSEDYNKALLVTRGEPFTVAITNSGILYAFPSLKYKTTGSTIKGNKAMYVAGSEEEPVVVCSIDKGYCPELYRNEDQGMVIAYAVHTSSNYQLRYKQYGYNSDQAMVKTWGQEVLVDSKPEAIFNVSVRRFSDYRIGLTYNFWETNTDGERIAKAEFRYSNRIYAGIAFHPEVIYMDEIPGVGPLLYGAARNDNIHQVEQLYLKKTKTMIGKDTTGFVLEFFNSNNDNVDLKKVEIEILDPEDPNASFENTNVADLIGLTVKNSFNYGEDLTNQDPEYGDKNNSIARITEISTKDNQLIFYLKSHGIPRTPYSIIPTADWGNKINIRFAGSDFNTTDLTKNISGWFALDGVVGYEDGSLNTVSAPVETATFYGFSVSQVKAVKGSISVQSTLITNTTLGPGTNWGWYYSGMNSSISLPPTILDLEDLGFNTINFGDYSFYFDSISSGGINVNI